MKFNDLGIENFLTIIKAKISLNDRGLQLIQGVNAIDTSAVSNGAGKSSIVDAICWVLFGQTARGVKGDEVVSLLSKKDCMVSLWMSDGTYSYRIVRHRKHGFGKNSLVVHSISASDGAVLNDLSKGTDTETQKVVEQLLGCSYEVFVAAVYSGQETMPDLPMMKDRELKTLIEEAAGLERIEKSYALARERWTNSKSAANVVHERTEAARANLVGVEGQLTHERARFDAWEADKVNRVEESFKRSEAASLELFNALLNLQKNEPEVAEARLRVKEIEAGLESHSGCVDKAKAADLLVRNAEMKIDTGELKRLVSKVKEFEQQIENAAEGVKNPCRECGTLLESMSIEDYVAHRQAHLVTARESLEAGKLKLQTQLAFLVTLKAAAAELHAQVPDVSGLSTELAACNAKISFHLTLDSRLSIARMNSDAAGAQLLLRQTEANPSTDTVENWTNQVKVAAAHLSDLEERGKVANVVAETSAAVVKVFGPAGVRAQILDTVTPYLNERTADYLSTLSDGNAHAVWTTLTKSAAGELKEKFSIDVTHDEGGDCFRGISGGEKRKVRLACALALQDLVASRATQPLDLWIGDEIDNALDAAGLERLMTLLERKAREHGTVLLISHSDLKDWCDNVTTVTKTARHHSVVEGSLCIDAA